MGMDGSSPPIGTGNFWISPNSTAVAIPETPTDSATGQNPPGISNVLQGRPLNIHVRRGLGFARLHVSHVPVDKAADFA